MYRKKYIVPKLLRYLPSLDNLNKNYTATASCTPVMSLVSTAARTPLPCIKVPPVAW